MREIKFRVWDTKSESMEHEIAIGKGYGEDSYILFLGIGETFIIDEDIVKVMQYTGLKDKNGIEIYEGDIIKTSEGVFVVEYLNSAFGLVKPSGDFYEYICNLCIMGGKVFEIIGNKYENPELLEQ